MRAIGSLRATARWICALRPGGGDRRPVVRDERPLVSVIMAVRNGERYIAQALESVGAQTYDHHETVVVDGASTDRSVQIASGHPGVRCIQQAGRTGFAGAWNDGIAVARGSLIAFLDSDDLWEPTKLERQIEILRAQPQVDYVITRVRFLAEPGVPLPPGFKPELLGTDHIANMPSALMIRRTALDTAGQVQNRPRGRQRHRLVRPCEGHRPDARRGPRGVGAQARPRRELLLHARGEAERRAPRPAAPVGRATTVRMTNSQAIVTLTIGAELRERWDRCCAESWRRYADLHGFDLICIDQPLDIAERARRRSPAWQRLLIADQPFAPLLRADRVDRRRHSDQSGRAVDPRRGANRSGRSRR